MLKFEPITKYEQGFISQLLLQGFADVMDNALKAKIEQFDREAFENLDTIGACVFVSTLNNEVVGMASWDPRQWPEIAIIGYNCILPDFHGMGFGQAQIKEVFERFRGMGFKKAIVTTGDHPFFIKAAKMYLACGFTEIRRYNEGRDLRYGSIDYEIGL